MIFLAILGTSWVGSLVYLKMLSDLFYGFGLTVFFVGAVSGVLIRIILKLTDKEPERPHTRVSPLVDFMPEPHYAESEHYACGDRD